MEYIMTLDHYTTLGRSGLAVSPLALGTMTFGTARWGSDGDASRAIFDSYIDAGGNFIDTADVYAGGRSEEMLGTYMAERGLRHDIVLSTKAGFAAARGAHRGGNGAKHLHAALEGSLRRLGTDYIDLFWVHVWDSVTPAEELLETMTSLVRSGKIRYWGMSNAPAWYVAELATLARLHGKPGPIALQYFYSLANRDLENEHLPLARKFGLGVLPWSPLAFGLLTGKYRRDQVEAGGARAGGLPTEAADPDAQRAAHDKRLDGANPFGDSLFTERNWKIADVVRQVADDLGATPAQVALAWVLGRPQVGMALLGVSRPAQLADNLRALDLHLPARHLQTLDDASTPAAQTLYGLFTPAMRQGAVFGGAAVASYDEQAGPHARC
jgi:aryl-alcohol dehydrogenase-like predicted oxidoreductase